VAGDLFRLLMQATDVFLNGVALGAGSGASLRLGLKEFRRASPDPVGRGCIEERGAQSKGSIMALCRGSQ
jgi:hypothetical protein